MRDSICAEKKAKKKRFRRVSISLNKHEHTSVCIDWPDVFIQNWNCYRMKLNRTKIYLAQKQQTATTTTTTTKCRIKFTFTTGYEILWVSRKHAQCTHMQTHVQYMNSKDKREKKIVLSNGRKTRWKRNRTEEHMKT